MNKKRLFPIGVIGLLAILLAIILLWQPATKESPLTPSLPIGGDFELQSDKGPVALKDYRGKVIALYFGYTWCPDVCPTSLSLLSAALNELTPQEQHNVQAFFISLDPERDTVERLDEYASYFNPLIMGVTNTTEQVAELAARYGAIYRKTETDEEGNYSVDHSSRIYLLDSTGQLQNILEHGTPSATILTELRAWLKEIKS